LAVFSAEAKISFSLGVKQEAKLSLQMHLQAGKVIQVYG